MHSGNLTASAAPSEDVSLSAGQHSGEFTKACYNTEGDTVQEVEQLG